MGGIKTDLAGRTNIKGLYAIGEVACTGVHGANRLASNSLLEGLLMGKRLAEILNSNLNFYREDSGTTTALRKTYHVTHPSFPNSEEISSMMMDCAGIVRTESDLLKLKNWLEGYEVEKWIENDLEHLTVKEIQEVFMLITAWLVTLSALSRTESRGGHFRMDYPLEDDEKWLRKQISHKRTIVKDEENEQIKASAATSAVFS